MNALTGPRGDTSAVPALAEPLDAPGLTPQGQDGYRDARNRGHSDVDSTLGDYWNSLWRHKAVILAAAVGGGLLGYLVTLPMTPVYRAAASLEIQDKNDTFLNMHDLDPNARSYSAESRLQTEIKIVQSRSLRGLVKSQLRRPGDQIDRPAADQLSQMLDSIGLPALARTRSRAQALEMAETTLSVENPRMSRIVQIVSESTDPAVAADFSNGLAEAYIELTVEGRLDSYQQVGQWLNGELKELRESLQDAEDALFKYSKESGLVFTNEADQKLNKLQAQLSETDVELIRAKSVYDLVTSRAPDTVPDVLDDSVIEAHRLKIAELRGQLGQLSTALKPEHYKVKRLQQQISDAEAQLEKELAAAVERIRNEYDAVKRRRKMLADTYTVQAGVLAEHNQKLIQYNMLKREVDSARNFYQSMLQKVNEAGIASALRASNVSIIDRAEPPSEYYRPVPVRYAVIGACSGLFLGVLGVFLRTSLDSTFRRPGQLDGRINIAELGVIPSQADRHGVGLPRMKVRFVGSKRLLTEHAGQNPNLPMLRKVSSSQATAHAESFRGIVMSILRSADQRKIFVITSAEAGAGKTTVTANLGRALAEIDMKVLLVDADLRRPRLHELFGLSMTPGLTDFLADAGGAVNGAKPVLGQETETSGLRLLPRGSRDVFVPKLLYSRHFADLLRRCREEFDMVLIDTPPVSEVTDPRVIATHADTVILVMRAAQTTREMANSVCRRLAADDVDILGTVLNDWDPKTHNPYGYSNELYS